MKRFLLFFLLMGTVFSAFAIDINELVKLGLPANASPAKFYFEHLFLNQNLKPTEADYEVSSFECDDNKYYLFVQPKGETEEGTFTRISLWMYDSNKNSVKEVFKQVNNEYDRLFIFGIDWLLNKQSTTKNYTIKATKQVIETQEFTYKPVIVLQSEIWTGFNHSREVVILLNPDSGKVKLLEDQRFVAISHTSTQALMGAEQGLAQDYIITTSTIYQTENIDLKPNEEVTIYNKQWVTPVINIYDTDGTLVSSQELKKQQINMVR